MSNVDSEVKKVWKFLWEGWDRTQLEGTFVASQDEIDWLTGQVINFGDTGKGLDLEIQMETDQFEIVNEDEVFAEQFKATMGTIGVSPFEMLDDDQFIAHELEFGVNGVKVSKPPRPEVFEDKGTQVITYGITEAIIQDDLGSLPQEDEDKFRAHFEIVEPEPKSVHLADHVEEYGNGVTICMKVIKRKNDGVLFGYPYGIYNGGDKMWEPSEGPCPRYVWLPVEPFTITGYKLSA